MTTKRKKTKQYPKEPEGTQTASEILAALKVTPTDIRRARAALAIATGRRSRVPAPKKRLSYAK